MLLPLKYYPMINMLLWNIKSATRASNLRQLRSLVGIFNLQLVAICEPKVKMSRFNYIRRKIRIAVGLVNSSASVWILFLKKLFSCFVVGDSVQYISILANNSMLFSSCKLYILRAKCTILKSNVFGLLHSQRVLIIVLG